MKLLRTDELMHLLQRLSDEGRVFLPRLEDETILFRRWEGDSPSLDALRAGNTALPAKDLLFPQTEEVFRFVANAQNLAIMSGEPDDAPPVIFGIRPCDAASIQMLDRVFLDEDFPETTYARRRDGAILVTWACTDVQDTCFCPTFGIDPAGPVQTGDIHVTDLDDELVLEATSDRGGTILDDLAEHLTDADQGAQDKVDSLREAVRESVVSAPAADDLAETLAGMHEDPIWEEMAFRCLGCGACTYLCPTCHCYDLDGETRGTEGVRFRCWDSCMFSDFTRMAGGENPRPTKRERVRNRFLHKLQYFSEKHGVYGCVGCGRCITHCPACIDIADFIYTVRGADCDE